MSTRLASLAVVLCVFWTASNAFAGDPEVCDPDTDPDNCQCPSGVYDTCYEIASERDLISPDDPNLLREVANIQSTWDSERGVYVVTGDVTNLSGGGLMKLNSNGGHWDTMTELNTYVLDLIGGSVSDCFSIPGFVPIEGRFAGTTTRFNQNTDKWAPVSFGNIIFDAITDENGSLWIDGVEYPLWYEASEMKHGCKIEANPVHSNNHPFDEDRYGTSELKAGQCTGAWYTELEVAQPANDWCSEDAVSYYNFYKSFTRLETMSTLTYESGITCTGAGSLQDPELCSWQQGPIVHRNVVADTLDIEHYWFTNQVYGDMKSHQPALQNTDGGVIMLEGYDPDEAGNGACAYGLTTQDNTLQTDTFTRDNEYDENHADCIF